MKSEICKCGHEEERHLPVMLDGACYQCKESCKKFKPKNHSPTEIGSQPNRSESLKEEGKPEGVRKPSGTQTLSDKIFRIGNGKKYPYFQWIEVAEKHNIKEFIKEENEIDIYRELCNKLGKVNVWRLKNDEICDEIEILLREKRNKLAGGDLVR